MKHTKLLSAVVCAATVLSFSGCTKKTDSQVKIGIAKIVQHEALDAVEQGVIDAVKAAGYDAKFLQDNANGDPNAASAIATRYRDEHVNVAVGIATPVAVAMATAIKDIPVVFGTVTDPVIAGLVDDVSKGKGNVTGMSDEIPTVEQIAQFAKIAKIKTLGYIYTSNEDNSVSSLNLVVKGCEAAGIKLVTQAITNSSEVKQAAEAIVKRVDGIYLSTDNTVFSALPSLVQVFNAANKPIYSADVTGAKNGGCFMASGFNYYKAGYATGEMVVQILKGAKPEDIPVRFMTEPADMDLLLNLDVAKACGLTFDKALLDAANMIIENGVLTEK